MSFIYYETFSDYIHTYRELHCMEHVFCAIYLHHVSLLLCGLPGAFKCLLDLVQ